MNFDDILGEIGGFGPYQIYCVVLTGLAFMVVGGHNLGVVFTGGLPALHCKSHEYDVILNTSSTQLSGYNANTSSDDVITMDSCFIDTGTNESEPCLDWDYDKDVFTSTIATQVGSRT